MLVNQISLLFLFIDVIGSGALSMNSIGRADMCAVGTVSSSVTECVTDENLSLIAKIE